MNDKIGEECECECEYKLEMEMEACSIGVLLSCTHEVVFPSLFLFLRKIVRISDNHKIISSQNYMFKL